MVSTYVFIEKKKSLSLFLSVKKYPQQVFCKTWCFLSQEASQKTLKQEVPTEAVLLAIGTWQSPPAVLAFSILYTISGNLLGNSFLIVLKCSSSQI